jgi:phage terminase Nu1 subunit (DNA packaging protein)
MKRTKSIPTPAPALITAEQLAALTDLTKRRLYQLAEERKIPPAENGRFPLLETIRALLRHYRTAAAQQHELRAAQTRLATANAAKVERENKKAKRELLEWETVERFLNLRFVNPMVTALDAAPKEVDREWVEKVLKPLLRQKLAP